MNPIAEGIPLKRDRQKLQNPANPESGGLSAIAELLVVSVDMIDISRF